MLNSLRRQPVPWIVRVLWLALPFTAGPALAAALGPLSGPVQAVASAALWAGWAIGMVASCAPLPLALSALRFVAPGGAAALVAAIVSGSPSPGAAALGLAWTALSTAWAYSPAFGEWCVNGPAYPNERRLPLRAPGPAIGGFLGVAVAWDLSVAGLLAGPLLLAARQWVFGTIAVAIGFPVAVVALRSLHGLSKRWVVFVPAGVVLHDPLALRDPVLFVRQSIDRLRAAEVPGGAVDLRLRAPGPALRLDVREPAPLTLMRFGQRLGEQVQAGAVLFVPSRPGAVLEEASRRRIATG